MKSHQQLDRWSWQPAMSELLHWMWSTCCPLGFPHSHRWSWSLSCTGRGCLNIHNHLLCEYLVPFVLWIFIITWEGFAVEQVMGEHFQKARKPQLTWTDVTMYLLCPCQDIVSNDQKYVLKKWEIFLKQMRNKLTVHWAVQSAPLQGPLQWWPASAQQRLLSFSPCHLSKQFVVVVVVVVVVVEKLAKVQTPSLNKLQSILHGSFIFSCPGSSIPDLGGWLGHWPPL